MHPDVRSGNRQPSIANRDLTTLFFRTTAAPLVHGNAVRVLLDAGANYPAWLDAIESARGTIHLEMYIVHDDRIGRQFRDVLAAKAVARVRGARLADARPARGRRAGQIGCGATVLNMAFAS